MPLRYRGLSPEPFRPLFELGEAQLQARGMRRVIADADWGFPCRVSLGDAAKGETLLLLPYTHQPADTPIAHPVPSSCGNAPLRPMTAVHCRRCSAVACCRCAPMMRMA